MTHPAQSKSLTTNQRCAGSGRQAAQTSCRTLSTSKEMETTGTQSRLKGESLYDYMQRLYYPARRGGAAISNPNKWDELKSVVWHMRPPQELLATAYKFMRENDVSVTTYLTYAMHNLHNESNA